MKRLFLATVIPVLLLTLSAQVAVAGCVLKRQAMADDPKCIGLVGYANGTRVGFFHWNGANVTVGGKCTTNHPSASLVGANRVQTAGGVRVLSDDCRSTTGG
jgi:hypothetical protein